MSSFQPEPSGRETYTPWKNTQKKRRVPFVLGNRFTGTKETYRREEPFSLGKMNVVFKFYHYLIYYTPTYLSPRYMHLVCNRKYGNQTFIFFLTCIYIEPLIVSTNKILMLHLMVSNRGSLYICYNKILFFGRFIIYTDFSK